MNIHLDDEIDATAAKSKILLQFERDLHCKNDIVNITTLPSDVHYFYNHYSVVKLKLSDHHYITSEDH